MQLATEGSRSPFIRDVIIDAVERELVQKAARYHHTGGSEMLLDS